MKIVIDDKIPYIKDPIKQLADEVVFVAGDQFTPEIVKNADALIVRTRTKCNEQLLKGSQVKFIATATIGYDHIDKEYCLKKGISWTNAPGCNASSVTQYVESVLLLLQQEKQINLAQATLGIVGVGHVGSKVLEMAHQYGLRILLCDPPKAETNTSQVFVNLEKIAIESDIITFHVPLTRQGAYPTYHLADEHFFKQLKKRPYLINTSRGEVVKTQAILDALDNGQIQDAVIDVWENEPQINKMLLDKVWIGTPHIAGYSADGKANATRMSLDALCEFYHLDKKYNIEAPAPEKCHIEANSKQEAILQIYNPLIDSHALKKHPESFEMLRGNYPLRREKDAFSWNGKPL